MGGGAAGPERHRIRAIEPVAVCGRGRPGRRRPGPRRRPAGSIIEVKRGNLGAVRAPSTAWWGGGGRQEQSVQYDQAAARALIGIVERLMKLQPNLTRCRTSQRQGGTEKKMKTNHPSSWQ